MKKQEAVAWQKNFKVLYLATAPLFSAFQYLTRKLNIWVIWVQMFIATIGEYDYSGVLSKEEDYYWLPK